jgi:hypothetical protein
MAFDLAVLHNNKCTRITQECTLLQAEFQVAKAVTSQPPVTQVRVLWQQAAAQ